MLAVFLGAGFSAPAGVPLASQLFDSEPDVDRITRRNLVERVVARWKRWHDEHLGAPEQYLAHLEAHGGPLWRDAQWYVGLRIALSTSRLEHVGMQPTITRHNLDRTTGICCHEDFWTAIFRQTEDVGVITTNYDILAERGLRTGPRPRVPRVGFHYEGGPEQLEGGGYPSYTHIQKICTTGRVPLIKLHGSVSWSYRDGRLHRYHDCRPAIRGDAAIVAPVTNKLLPPYLQPAWGAAERILRSADCWVFVGYSLPEYDHLVRTLLQRSCRRGLSLHILDIDNRVSECYQSLLPDCTVHLHPGLPDGILAIRQILCDSSC